MYQKKCTITIDYYGVLRSSAKQDRASLDDICLRQSFGHMFYLYALLSRQNNDIYIGYCEDLEKRFREHNNGQVKTTRGYKPWKLVYYEAYLASTTLHKGNRN